MSSKQDIRRQGPGVYKTGPRERFIVKFTREGLTLLMSAALVLADIPGFGLQADASLATGTSKGSLHTKEVA